MIVKCAVGTPTHNTLIDGGINGLTKWQLESKKKKSVNITHTPEIYPHIRLDKILNFIFVKQ